MTVKRDQRSLIGSTAARRPPVAARRGIRGARQAAGRRSRGRGGQQLAERQVTSIEQQVKKVNFTLLVRIKNQLDSEQQEKLRALRPAHPFGPPGGPPP